MAAFKGIGPDLRQIPKGAVFDEMDKMARHLGVDLGRNMDSWSVVEFTVADGQIQVRHVSQGEFLADSGNQYTGGQDF